MRALIDGVWVEGTEGEISSMIGRRKRRELLSHPGMIACPRCGRVHHFDVSCQNVRGR